MHLPSGILSILLSLVPIFAFPIALALGMDRFSAAALLGCCWGWRRAADRAARGEPARPGMVWWLPLALVAPLFYAIEGNFVARFGTAGWTRCRCCSAPRIVGSVMACRWR
jgi:drug/metabolite transporter (DMT)-like permease